MTRKPGALLLTAGIGLLLAACGGSATVSSAPAASPASTSPSAAPASASAAPSSAAAPASASAPPSAATSSSAAAAPGASGSAAAKPAASGSASASPTPAQATVKVTANATLGNILTDGNGRTLYTFDATTTDPLKCTGPCLGPWPAFQSGAAPTAPSGVTGTLAIITRSDNQQKQVTYNNLPLYYFAPDTAPGDAKGQGSKGFGGSWQVVKVG